MRYKLSPGELISERTFTAQVIQYARRMGWLTAHFRPARTLRGNWVTAVQGDGAGFPDLVLAKNGNLIFAELKNHSGVLTAKQKKWLEALRTVDQVGCYIWRPKDWGDIKKILEG